MLPHTKSLIPNPKTRAMLLSALYIAQEQYGWLSPEAINRVAERLRITPGQVYATASFYTMFKLNPQGQFRIQVCEGLSCYLVGGSEPIIEYIKQRLNLTNQNVSADGKFSLEIVECLAACDFAPAIKVNDDLYGNITDEKLDGLLEELSTRG
jgi:NADH-quinone oxidoreductase E subunit